MKGIKSIEGANKCLKNEFIDKLNRKFMKSPQSLEDAHVGLMAGQCLKDILCWEYTRVVHNDWTIRFENQRLQIPKSARQIRPKNKLSVKKGLNGKLTVWYKGKTVPYSIVTCEVKTEEKPRLGHDTPRRSQISRSNKHKTPWGQFNPNWLTQTAKPAEISI